MSQSQRVKELLVKNQTSLREIAEQTGIGLSLLRSIVDDTDPNKGYAHRLKIARAFRVTPAEIFDDLPLTDYSD